MNTHLANLVVTLILSLTPIFYGVFPHDGAQAGQVTELAQNHDAQAPMKSNGSHHGGAVLCDAVAGHCPSVMLHNQAMVGVLDFGSSNIKPAIAAAAALGSDPQFDTPPPRV